MKWKRKKGHWRAQSGDNQYVICPKTAGESGYIVKSLRPVMDSSWRHYEANSIDKAKSICEDIDESTIRISEYEKNKISRRREMLENIFNSKTKQFMRAYRHFLKLSESDLSTLANSEDPKRKEMYNQMTNLKARGFNPDKMFYTDQKRDEKPESMRRQVDREISITE